MGLVKSEKETLHSVLDMKADDARKTVNNEEKRYAMSKLNSFRVESEMTWRDIRCYNKTSI